jgi:predicted transposase YdaD
MKCNFANIGEVWKQQALAEGRAEGIALGRAEGRVKGRAEGRAKGRAEGRAKGRAEGEAKGRLEAKAEALACLLAQRFGTLSPSIQRRIRKANLGTLERWFKRAVLAPNVAAVFRRSR